MFSRIYSEQEVYFHGESLVAGDLDTHDWLCSALAQLSRALVLSVAYRQPPEVSPPASEGLEGGLFIVFFQRFSTILKGFHGFSRLFSCLFMAFPCSEWPEDTPSPWRMPLRRSAGWPKALSGLPNAWQGQATLT